jgi:hypothetical protein
MNTEARYAWIGDAETQRKAKPVLRAFVWNSEIQARNLGLSLPSLNSPADERRHEYRFAFLCVSASPIHA